MDQKVFEIRAVQLLQSTRQGPYRTLQTSPNKQTLQKHKMELLATIVSLAY